MFGKTITSAIEKAPARYEPAATLVQETNEWNAPVSVHVSVCVCVCVAHTLPSAGNLPRVWAQRPERPCFSSQQTHVSPPQGQTSHSRWLNLRRIVIISLSWVIALSGFVHFFHCVVLVCAYLTEFISEGETLHHALVHQRLFRRAVGDQLDALGLELTLSQNNRAHVCLFFNPLKWCEEAAFYSMFLHFTSRYKHAATDSFSMLFPCLKAGSWQNEITLSFSWYMCCKDSKSL